MKRGLDARWLVWLRIHILFLPFFCTFPFFFFFLSLKDTDSVADEKVHKKHKSDKSDKQEKKSKAADKE